MPGPHCPPFFCPRSQLLSALPSPGRQNPAPRPTESVAFVATEPAPVGPQCNQLAPRTASAWHWEARVEKNPGSPDPHRRIQHLLLRVPQDPAFSCPRAVSLTPSAPKRRPGARSPGRNSDPLHVALHPACAEQSCGCRHLVQQLSQQGMLCRASLSSRKQPNS